MTDRRAYLLQASHDLHAYIGAQSLDDTADFLGGLVQHFERPLRVALSERQPERDRARDLAVALEAQNAAALALHAPVEYGTGEDHAARFCDECAKPWPCGTALALGVDLLTDDALVDLTEVGA